MASITKRTTFALDKETITRLKKMASLWHVSQSEAVRRSIEKMEQKYNKENKLLLLKDYYSKGGLSPQKADSYMTEVAENRSEWLPPI